MYCFRGKVGKVGEVGWGLAIRPLHGGVRYLECPLMEVPLYIRTMYMFHVICSDSTVHVHVQVQCIHSCTCIMYIIIYQGNACHMCKCKCKMQILLLPLEGHRQSQVPVH